MKINRFGALLSLAALGTLSVFAAPTPIPASLANGNAWLQFSGDSFNNLIGPYNAGFGGAFQPVISSLNATGDGPNISNSQLTTVWCVDYQLDVSAGSSYAAKLKTLNNITTPDSGVRYGNIDTVGAGGWSHALTGTGALDSNSAQTRYLLAAALVSEYDNGSQVVDASHPANDSRNQAIQEAVWYITYNSEYSSGDWANTGIGNKTCTGAFDPNNYMCWVGQAESNVNTVNKSSWAVVSGPVETAGADKGNLGSPQNNQYQTFLVQVSGLGGDSQAPEPSFYGVLALGLGGLFAMAYRRKQARS